MAKTAKRHFLDLKDLDERTLRALIDTARDMKSSRAAKRPHAMLNNKKLAMIFEKPSTRTRVSFEAGMQELGGQALNLSSTELQIGRGESIADTARVLSRYVDAMMMRAYDHESIEELAKYATVPVINGLTDKCHPCQIMADIMTFEEYCGPIKGATVAWIGDGNNVCNSWIAAAVKFGFNLRIACPEDLCPEEEYIDFAKKKKGSVTLCDTPVEAVKGAKAVVTDTWVSMGQESSETRKQLLRPYQINESLMKKAVHGAIFMHCLPAHRGEEVTAEVIDGPHSAVWDEAENRLHVQKSILVWAMGE